MSMLLLAALVALPVHALEFNGLRVPDEDLPLSWWLVPDQDHPTLDVDQQQALFADALQAWQNAVPCVDLAGGYQGQAKLDSSYSYTDGRNTVRYDDPDAINSDNVPAVTYGYPKSDLIGQFLVGNQVVYLFPPMSMDMVWTPSWTPVGPDEPCDKEAHQAIGEFVSLREIAFMLGLTVNCSETDPFAPCTDIERQAVMYPDADPCDPSLVEPGWDDVRGIMALYTPIGLPTEQEMPTIVLGDELCWQRTAPFDADQPVTWSLSDGTEAQAVDLCHTFTEPGYQTVDLSWEGCDAPAWADALVCEVPAAPVGEPHLFTASVDGDTLSLTLLDLTADSRCVTGVDWAVTSPDGETEHAFTTETSFTVGPGIWTVDVVVLGIADDVSDVMEITVGDEPGDEQGDGTGCGCGAAGAPGLASLLLALLPGLIVARRRQRGSSSGRAEALSQSSE